MEAGAPKLAHIAEPAGRLVSWVAVLQQFMNHS
jgi:hypothetical protein